MPNENDMEGPFGSMQSQDVLEALQLGRGRTKRHHQKSRSGCAVCKRRKVKCDETRPACHVCRRKGLACEYGSGFIVQASTSEKTQLPSPTRSATISTPSSPLELPRDAPSITSNPGEQCIDASELARVYLEQVAHSFSSSSTRPEQTWIWHVFIPSQAYSSETVRHGMFVAAAMWLHLTNQQDNASSEGYLETAYHHGTLFVEQSMSQLHVLDPSRAETHLACTRLLCLLGLAFYRHRRACGIGDAVEWTWVHLLRGVPTVHASVLAFTTTLHPNLIQDMVGGSRSAHERSTDVSMVKESNSAPIAPLLAYVRRTQQQRLATLRFAHSQDWFDSSRAHHEVFAKAIDDLSYVTGRVCGMEVASLFRVVVAWIAQLPETLINLLKEDHPGMLAIYTHWLMLAVLVEDLWWVGDLGVSGIRAALAVLAKTENDLAPVLTWPREMLELQAGYDSST